MNRKYFYIIVACTILCLLLIGSFFLEGQPKQETNADIQVATPPFLTYITGTGTVEPVSGNILVTSPFNRVVEKVNVSTNEQVKKGTVLFQLFNEDLQANLKVKQKKYEESLANLSRQEALPQPEDLKIAQENLNKAQAAFNQAVVEYRMSSCRAMSKDARCISSYEFQQAEATFRAAQAQFEKVQLGAWPPELKIAQAQVEQAKADVDAMKAELEQTYVKSPIDGTILQIKIHEGETVNPSKTAIILGNVDELNLRVGIDQFNVSKFHPDARAVAFKQGDNTTEFPLTFIRIQPVMVPKKYLTNELNERVDTQIFEILYRIEKKDAQLYVGQQMNVYIYYTDPNK